jgi:hypothetical protein
MKLFSIELKDLFFKAALLFLFSVNILADTLVLKDGTVLQGTMKSATEFSIIFETDGETKEVKINDITTVAFTPRAEQAVAAAPAAAGGAVSIPANTKITARTSEDISTAANQQGSKVTAELELDIIVDGQVAVPKGSVLYGTVTESIGGRRIGNQSIKINFNEIVINGQTIPISTDPIGAEGGRGSAAKLVGASALIGAAAGDAGKGAAVGAGLALLAGGKHIQIPKETLFDLLVKQEVKINL